jgi:hypothetical protein
MNCKKSLGLFLILAALTSALWVSRSSLRPSEPPSSDMSAVSAPRERRVERSAATPKRPWENLERRRIAGPPVFPPKPAPQELQIEWHGGWYAAEILSSSGSSNLIRYKGYGAEWDEWVSSERMRFVAPGGTPPEMTPGNDPAVFLSGLRFMPTDAPAPPRRDDFVVHGSPGKDELLVQWGSGWWPAEVLQSQGTNHLIRYKGYGAEWDEWVDPQRMGLYEGDTP